MLPTRSMKPYRMALPHLWKIQLVSLSIASFAWKTACLFIIVSDLPTAIPPSTAVINAANGRMTAKAGPSNDHVATILSIPVCGVEMRKEVEAALEAPLRRMAIAVGSTPQEQRGKGIPIAADLMTDFQPIPDRCRANVRCGINACMIPAIRKPNNMYGDISLSINRSVCNSSMFVSFFRYYIIFQCFKAWYIPSSSTDNVV